MSLPAGNQIVDSAKLRVIAINRHDDKYVAVGAKDGTVRIIDSESWKSYLPLKNTQNKEITALSFSPDGGLLVAGSSNGFIDVYKVPEFKRKASLKKHEEGISHFDWSENSKFLQ